MHASMLIAQLTDTHVTVEGRLLHGRFDGATHLQRCLEHILHLPRRPDLLLFTGDLAEGGQLPEYQRLRGLLDPVPIPKFIIPGNHDRRTALLAPFPELSPSSMARSSACGGTLQRVESGYPLRVVGLDTLREGCDEGYFDAHQAEWLEAVLHDAADLPVLIAMHHPPVATGLRLMDTIRLEPESTVRLAAVVSRHRNIQSIVCGHVHRAVQAIWCGIGVSVCPSSAFQIVPDLEAHDYQPSVDEPPAYQLHFWESGMLTTHTVTVT